jgi:hypothetical protein
MGVGGHCGIPDNRGMPPVPDSEHHWVVPFAAIGTGDARPEWPALPHLQALLPRLRETQRSDAGETTYTAPHERALAAARGVPHRDGHWPGAALHSGDPHAPQAWVHPVHLQVGMGEVTLQAAAQFGLDEAAARRLFDALAPLCAEDGVALHFDHPTRWRASGERLRGLRCASIDRVAGRSIAPWLPEGDEARWLQRLMSEAQMLFYTHAVNDAREAARQLPVNGVWFSAAGAVEPGVAPRPAPTLADDLREHALRGDAGAWRAAWQALDAALMARLNERVLRGEAFALTLCGEHNAVTFEPAPPTAGQRLVRALGLARTPNVQDLLKTL